MLLSAASSCLFWLLSVRLMSKPDIPPTRHMPNNVPATTDKATESDVSECERASMASTAVSAMTKPSAPANETIRQCRYLPRFLSD